MSAESANRPWQDGVYKMHYNGSVFGHLTVNGTKARFSGFGTETDDVALEHGAFDCDDTRGRIKTGHNDYAIKITINLTMIQVNYANVNADGKSWTLESGEPMEYLVEAVVKKMEDNYEPGKEYTHYYTPKPEGKLLFLTGASGMGKTATSEHLKQQHGFVLYEGDAFLLGANPYVKNSPEGPSVCGTKLIKKNFISKERAAASKTLINAYFKLFKQEEVPITNWTDFYDLLCKDINKERAQLGGDWVVPQAVYTRGARDFIRENLGPKCIFVVLNMPNELQIKRMAMRDLGTKNPEDVTKKAREKSSKKFEAMGAGNGYELKQPDEPNTVQIDIEESMTLNDVVNLILEKENEVEGN